MQLRANKDEFVVDGVANRPRKCRKRRASPLGNARKVWAPFEDNEVLRGRARDAGRHIPWKVEDDYDQTRSSAGEQSVQRKSRELSNGSSISSYGSSY